MTNEQKFENLVKEANRLEGHEVWQKKDYDYLSKGWLKMEYSEDPKLNKKFDCEVTDETIPFFDNTLIDLIRVCERRYNENNFILNGHFPKKNEIKEKMEATKLYARRFEFFKLMLRINNLDAYMKYID